jgi:methyl-accepting chemotaxis protein
MDQEMKEYLERRLLTLAAKDDVEKLRQEVKANFRQLTEEGKTNISEWKRETQTVIDQSNRILTSSLQQIKEVGSLGEQVKQMAEMIAALDGKITKSLMERKEELGPASPVSYADLENKIKELEAKVKTLEKMVLP